MNGLCSVTAEVAAAMTIIGTFACVAIGAVANAVGVRPKPARNATLSLTTSSCASRRVVSAVPASSFRMTSIFLPADGAAVLRHVDLDRRVDLAAGRRERPRHRQDQADLHRVLRERRRCETGGERGRDHDRQESTLVHAAPPCVLLVIAGVRAGSRYVSRRGTRSRARGRRARPATRNCRSDALRRARARSGTRRDDR